MKEEPTERKANTVRAVAQAGGTVVALGAALVGLITKTSDCKTRSAYDETKQAIVKMDDRQRADHDVLTRIQALLEGDNAPEPEPVQMGAIVVTPEQHATPAPLPSVTASVRLTPIARPVPIDRPPPAGTRQPDAGAPTLVARALPSAVPVPAPAAVSSAWAGKPAAKMLRSYDDL